MIGPNGAGKTTVFRMIVGQEQPDGGSLEVGDSVRVAYVDQARADLDPGRTVWQEISGGKDQITLNRWSLELGGHCRTGLEDNVRMSKEKLAPSNAALVKRVAELCAEHGRRPATVAQARSILGL